MLKESYDKTTFNNILDIMSKIEDRNPDSYKYIEAIKNYTSKKDIIEFLDDYGLEDRETVKNKLIDLANSNTDKWLKELEDIAIDVYNDIK